MMHYPPASMNTGIVKGGHRTVKVRRREQLGLATRRQRHREKWQSLLTCQLGLPRRLADNLQAGTKHSDIEHVLYQYLDKQTFCIDDYVDLRLLAWNRAGRYATLRRTFGLYERNWRHVDTATVRDAES